ncbi:BolA family protein [Marinicaulis aureus]|uniref:BolA family protein n=1 Tax=Hyphococcus aureus TaxID=2666033 RepID=A0ABW1KYS2_9PROT
MRVSDSIHQKLTDALKPERLEVKDESHLHAGHAGAREGGESHFRLLIVASAFEGLNRVARQRMVNDVLREELREQIHALAMKTLTPEEDAA